MKQQSSRLLAVHKLCDVIAKSFYVIEWNAGSLSFLTFNQGFYFLDTEFLSSDGTNRNVFRDNVAAASSPGRWQSHMKFLRKCSKTMLAWILMLTIILLGKIHCIIWKVKLFTFSDSRNKKSEQIAIREAKTIRRNHWQSKSFQDWVKRKRERQKRCPCAKI